MSPVFNPATGEVTAQVPVPDAMFVNDVIEKAREASLSWRNSSLSQRTNILFTFRQLLVEHADELARLITNEHGKTFADAKGELARGLENVEYACGLTEHLKGGFSSQVADGVDVHSLREPVGVVAAITPFNFPAMVPLWMSANALATGNVVILKPSERDPSTAVRLGELLSEAGLPDGVFTVLQGNASTVNQLLEHQGVDAISFVGSTPVARHVYQTGTTNGKRVQALGGAKNHMVVLPDADLDIAADAAINAGYGAAGERCMAISVVVAVGDIAEPLIEKITERLDRLTVGAGDDPASDFGPVITAEHRDRIVNYVDTAPADGISVVRDGTSLKTRPGFFVGPCLLDGVRPGTRSYDDEIFGPVLGVARVASYADAVALINANPYGNGIAIFTRDGNAARLFSREVTRRHDRHQRPDPGAGVLVLVRRVEELALRPRAHLRTRRFRLLHPSQGHHHALAAAVRVPDRPRLPDHPIGPPTARHVLDWVGAGLKESLAMLWMTWWPIVVGFTLSGAVQSFLPRDGLRSKLGRTTAGTSSRAALLGVISSSCSYAASAMSRALFARGASWTNAIIFMVASTNLVIELGIVLYLLLGWQFVAAQFVGGALMVTALLLLTGLFFSKRRQAQLRERVLADAPPAPSGAELDVA